MPGAQNSNSNQIIVNVDKPTETVTIHKNTCPFVGKMGGKDPKNGEEKGFPTIDDAIKYARGNYKDYDLKICKICFTG